jgi:hypothetical protein
MPFTLPDNSAAIAAGDDHDIGMDRETIGDGKHKHGGVLFPPCKVFEVKIENYLD